MVFDKFSCAIFNCILLTVIGPSTLCGSSRNLSAFSVVFSISRMVVAFEMQHVSYSVEIVGAPSKLNDN